MKPKKPRKPKPYTGEVQFDVWGNLVEWVYTQKKYLTIDDFENGKILWDKWDHINGKHVKVPTFFTPEQLEFVPYDVPKTWTVSYGKPETYIGECNQFVAVPNYEFKDTLVYDDYRSSQYSKFFIMTSQTDGREYRVFLKHLKDFISIMDKGVATATFTFIKNNHKFGITPV